VFGFTLSGTRGLQEYKVHVLVGGVTAASVAFIFWFMHLQSKDQEKRARKAAKEQQQAAQSHSAGNDMEQQQHAGGQLPAPFHNTSHGSASASKTVGQDVESGLTQPLLAE
jgi:hypothetical protein